MTWSNLSAADLSEGYWSSACMSTARENKEELMLVSAALASTQFLFLFKTLKLCLTGKRLLVRRIPCEQMPCVMRWKQKRKEKRVHVSF